MARQRRGGGLRPPELRGTLGTLLRTTREVLERGVSSSRERLDEALASRRRDSALADLGEIVLDLVRRGGMALTDLPEAREVVARLDDLDGEDADAGTGPAAIAARRDRFDRRAREGAADGTVSSQTWAPPNRKRPTGADRVWRPPVSPVSPVSPPSSDDDLAAVDRPTVRGGRKSPRRGGIAFDEPAATGAAGADDHDSDLADYMHPDDVPPKPRPDGDS